MRKGHVEETIQARIKAIEDNNAAAYKRIETNNEVLRQLNALNDDMFIGQPAEEDDE